MKLLSLQVRDFRCFGEAILEPDPDATTVITGPNGVGKTSLLEAAAYLATLRSFRGASREAMVRSGAERAIVRAAAVAGERRLTLEAELSTVGRSRTLVNRQTVRRRTDLAEALRVTVFSPEDLGIVRGPPGERRRYLDEALAVVEPRSTAAADDVDRVLRQRAALLRQARGRHSAEVDTTLEVWDARLVTAGETLVAAREVLAGQLAPVVAEYYERLAGTRVDVALAYRRSWSGDLAEALAASRVDDLRRGVTLVGPHRDDLDLVLGGLPARSHASQGEQRTLALALRLSGHRLATERLDSAPVLLFDDVFSELDEARSAALLTALPPGQALLTTASAPPVGVVAARTFAVAGDGTVRETTGSRS